MGKLETEEYFGILIFIAIIANKIVKSIPPFPNLWPFFYKIKDALVSKPALIIYAVILTPTIIYLNYKFNYWLIKSRERREVEKKEIEEEKRIVRSLLKEGIKDKNSKELKELFGELKEKLGYSESNDNLKEFRDEILEKMEKIKYELPMIIKQERLAELADKKEILEESIKELEEQIKHKEIEKREYENASLNKLNAYRTRVFLEEDLTTKEKELLLRNEFKRAYEYCLDQQKPIHVLVNPTLRHSVTHTFLVWSAKRMLKKIKGIRWVNDWDTREADIIFNYNGKAFALEIETGTILSKKRQLRAKIDYLNSKYKNRWLIVVSRVSLLPKYRKYGSACSRSELPKRLKKLLKSVSPS